MFPLMQRLRELEYCVFQQLCLHILKEKYPNATIKQVHGAGGDKGVDLFAGQFQQGLFVWECKNFPNGIKRSQRRQIEKSLKTTLRHIKPQRWTLCVSLDLTTESHVWFQKLETLYAGQVEIKLMQASDVVHELIHRHNLRDAFFPGAQLDPTEIRSLLSKTGDLSVDQLGMITAENVEQFVRRLEEKDPRFTFRVTFPEQSSFPKADNLPQGTLPPGLVFSITDKDKRVDAFARDIEGITLDPLKGTLRLKASALEKLQRQKRLGSTEVISAEEILQYSTGIDSFLPSGWRLGKIVLGPSANTRSKVLSLRVSFTSGQESVVYDLLEFGVARAGTEEVELITLDASLPFRFSVVIQRGRAGRMNYREAWEGKEVHAVKKACRLFGLFRASARISLFDLKAGKSLATAKVTQDVPKNDEHVEAERLIDDLVSLSDGFGVPIFLRSVLDEDSLRNIQFLQDILRDGRVTVNAENISLMLVKEAQFVEEFLKLIGAEHRFRVEHPRQFPPPQVMDAIFDTGPVTTYCSRAVFAEPEEAKQNYNAAKEGEGVRLSFRPLAPVELIFHKFLPPHVNSEPNP